MPQNLDKWVLPDIDERYPSFIFPSYISEPDASIKIHTNEIHHERGGFSFVYGSVTWKNSNPDIAVLYDAQRQ